MKNNTISGWNNINRENYLSLNKIIDSNSNILKEEFSQENWFNLISGVWNCINGYNFKIEKKAIYKALDIPPSNLIFDYKNSKTELVSAKLLEMLDTSGKISFAVTGSQAIDRAIRISINLFRKKFKKVKLISIKGSYHGELGFARLVSSPKGFEPPKIGEDGIKVKKLTTPYCLNCPLKKDKRNCNAECLEKLEYIMKSYNGGIILILEPIQITNGCLNLPEIWYHKINLIKKNYQDRFIIIADEVACGSGRFGNFFAHKLVKLNIDICVLGKSLSGGILPISCIIINDKIINMLNKYKLNFAEWGSTYDGYIISIYVVHSILEFFNEKKFVKNSLRIEKILKDFFYKLNRKEQYFNYNVFRTCATLKFKNQNLAKKIQNNFFMKNKIIYRDCNDIVIMPSINFPSKKLIENLENGFSILLKN